ncbi:biogenesis of lysosome-related organelles complex 1 subunit 2 [Lontra canadensis]|uniref:biogenesis of lysosome-related organelles complex 1 subunit 2 n=1 Tax=Lontra canadensis TaxID=76717 RepID=UPI0013F389F9|nr:biogenesis of lysosome-related organelles complex 1 subunit 2 [Lontra canadensis]
MWELQDSAERWSIPGLRTQGGEGGDGGVGGARPVRRRGCPTTGSSAGPGMAAAAAAAAAAQGVPATPREEPVRDDAAVETAEEAKEPAEADITELCRDMFSKMATYLTGELTATSEDYKLLENMNKLTSLKYLEMKDIAINISRNLKDLNQKYAGLQPYLDQINVIEEQVAALEQAAYKLDAYSKKLEAKYKKLEKR